MAGRIEIDITAALPSGATMGDLYSRFTTINEAAGELFAAYENDVQVAGIAARAANLRDLADGLTNVLYEIDAALTGLL